jgi:hypothetical protein
LALDRRADGRYDRVRALAADLVRGQGVVIVATGDALGDRGIAKDRRSRHVRRMNPRFAGIEGENEKSESCVPTGLAFTSRQNRSPASGRRYRSDPGFFL